MSKLRRTAIYTKYGSWKEKSTSTIENPIPIPYEDIFPNIPQKEMTKKEYEDIKLGKELISEES